MNQQLRKFRLGEDAGQGLACDDTGLCLGGTPLLERDGGQGALAGWRPLPLADLNAAVSARYGLPIDLAAKLHGLGAIAAALDRGDLVLAKLTALHLRLPDPPDLAKGAGSEDDLIELAYGLQAAGVLAKIWTEGLHPRWPAGTPDSAGGRFAPAGEDGAAQAAPTPKAPKKPHAHHVDALAPSPLASSLDRTPQKLSPHSRKLLAGLQAKLADPTNQGVVTFDSRDAALKDMGYFFSADITKFDPPDEQLERGAVLIYGPVKNQWCYDRSRMAVGTSGTVGMNLGPAMDKYGAGNVIFVHIHPLIAVPAAPGLGDAKADEDNAANRTFSVGPKLDTGTLSALSGPGHIVQAAVIGSDGSISYTAGGDQPGDYEGKNVTLVAPRGTIPMLNPN